MDAVASSERDRLCSGRLLRGLQVELAAGRGYVKRVESRWPLATAQGSGGQLGTSRTHMATPAM